MKDFLLVIDAGTSGVQSSLFCLDDFSMHGNNKVDFPQIYPHPGWVEHNPEDIRKATILAVSNAIHRTASQVADFHTGAIAAIGLTNQRETCLAWNRRTGETAGNAIVWQDRRTAMMCDAFKSDEKISRLILEKTGLVCDPYFSASKMQWILANHSEARRWLSSADGLSLGTIDSYLIWHLTGGRSFVTDATNASRTQLYHLQEGSYDSDLKSLFGIPGECLPEIRPCTGPFGLTRGFPGIPDGIPITGCLGDQQAALLGHRCLVSGSAKITFGTGSFLLMHTGSVPCAAQNGLLSTIAFRDNSGTSFALEGSSFIAGAAAQFLRDNFEWVASTAETSEIATSSLPDPNLIFVPSLTGLAAPEWNPRARGVLFGLTRGTQKGQVIRAVLEGVAFQNVRLLRLMEKISEREIGPVVVDGGASRNDFLIQTLADTLQTEIARSANVEATSLGAAFAAAAGLAGGKLSSSLFPAELTHKESFYPSVSLEEAEEKAIRWEKAVECVDAFYREK